MATEIGTEANKLSSGHGVERVFFVEARSIAGPQSVGGLLLTDKWIRIPVTHGRGGVIPSGPFVNPQALGCGYMDYEAADALAAVYRAMLTDDRQYRPYGVETRIVVVRFEYDYKSERVHDGPSTDRKNELNRVSLEASHAD